MIRVGTAGWHYDDWDGLVYPKPKPKGFDPLSFLAEHFDAVEVNVTFYRAPSPTVTATWPKRVAGNPNFRFTVKTPRLFTHQLGPFALQQGASDLDIEAGRRATARHHADGSNEADPYGGTIVPPQGAPGADSDTVREHLAATGYVPASGSHGPHIDAEERRFREAIAPIVESGRLGALLLQFPQSFHPTDAALAYLDELLDRFGDLPCVAEFRHAGWDAPEPIAHLRARRAGFCNIDQPAVAATLRPTELVTAPTAYVRFHGRNAAAWFPPPGVDVPVAQRYDYLYALDELHPWIASIRRIAEEGADTFVITNNHFRGKAAVNALQIKAALEGAQVEVPDTLLAAYPILAPIARPKPGTLPF